MDNATVRKTDVIVSLVPGVEYQWVAKFNGNQARSFAAADTATISTISDWDSLVLMINGGPASTTLVQCEVFLNIEATLNGDGAYDGIQGQYTPPNQILADIAGSFSMGNVYTAGRNVVSRYVTDKVKQYISDPIRLVESGLSALLF
jgi:hypothetical protein